MFFDQNGANVRSLVSVALSLVMASVLCLTASCGGDDPSSRPPPGSEADYHGVGASCDTNDDCEEKGQECIKDFAGGYCGVKDCKHNGDCPDGSSCVKLNAKTYCFLNCVEKVDCNRNRPTELESNCSANVELVDGKKGVKSCVPPSSGSGG